MSEDPYVLLRDITDCPMDNFAWFIELPQQFSWHHNCPLNFYKTEC